jgi:nucleotide-binding universal stress UspA family protein
MKAIIALDDSAMSEQLVKAVVSRTWPESTQVKILTVLEPINLPFSQDGSADFLVKAVDDRKIHAVHLCEKVRTRLLDHEPTLIVHFEVREGSPAAEIIESATEWPADKIFIGSHGKGAVTHNLLGSVSHRVANHSPCSVEIVRPKAAAKKSEEAAQESQFEATAGRPTR